jgi:hypothetical protein
LRARALKPQPADYLSSFFGAASARHNFQALHLVADSIVEDDVG